MIRPLLVLLACCVVTAALPGCGGDSPAPSETAAETAAPVPEKLDPSYDHVVAAEGTLLARQIGVRDSVAVPNESSVDLIDVGHTPPRVLVAGAEVRFGRWEVSGFNLEPTYPASGFVVVKLARNQWQALEGRRIVLRPARE